MAGLVLLDKRNLLIRLAEHPTVAYHPLEYGNMVSATSFRGLTINRAERVPLRDRIECVTEDLKEIQTILSITISFKRTRRLREFITTELSSLLGEPFDVYNQQDKVDYLLLKNYLERQLRDLELNVERDEKAKPLLPFATTLVELCEAREAVDPVIPKNVAEILFRTQKDVVAVIDLVENTPEKISVNKSSAFRAAKTVDDLREHLTEWFGFYKGYDPLFDWWVASPYSSIDSTLERLSSTIREKLVGIKPGDEDVIVGEPIDREGLLAELQAEMIPYTPEEIISIGEKEFEWCVRELKKASQSMGFGDDWKKALEEVKNDYVEPGQQTQLVKGLAHEAISFVEEHNLITVPQIAKETWQMFMMSPERQKVNPFFLGGSSIIVSYPTDTMDHEAKLMSMRGNNIHFARATVFHELIPGHRLQFYMNARHRPYRQLFDTPFWIEGWSLYWEMILWDDDRFVKTPQNRIGMLFWRLHRCARIIFSINFHLGRMTAQECIDLLVNEVGHERATAEGEVRRSLAGDYSPLYQAGYMLGALQIYSLRKEVVGGGFIREIDFHNRFLKENRMPIELMRALICEMPLGRDYSPSWRFYRL
ncbi:hypothetical protein P170DRAFT_455595 [Aspergillus steynii IBT 23096]|uniref:X-Pro dipeptidyl-peptidase n=1 Tax=Aspergillus steynii IBT 23096 TaxID=1392250 RepID=A0A2I2G6Z7_9EURO|nr:uncharacterized protein P170DRAFT_455595 [Aspergillus steynii IBT 23096]PLB48648.1 hypothetical protein P170DRAFT_455595 [Aspergillus steynii IBT 23096]